MSEDASAKTCSFDVCCECTCSCCQDAKPPLTQKRKRIIEDYLKNHGNVTEKIFTSSGYSYPSVDVGGFCIFYDKGTKKCVVHQVKPETCRAGPVTFDINLRTQKVEWFLKKGELCLFAGTLFEAPGQLDEHLKVAKEEIMRLICGLGSAALLAVLKIDEPQTFKIGEDPLPKEVLEKLGLE
jgi:Fe-S-cluster containining protein